MKARGRTRVLLALALAGGLLTAPAARADRPTGRGAAGFQRPTQERAVALDEEEGDLEEETLPESFEERLYLRDRPDALGAAAREYQEATLEALIAEREQWAAERRMEAIGLLETFVRSEPETAVEMPDALLRLAELRWELARLEYLTAFAAWQAQPEGRRGAEPRPDYRVSMALYDRILARHRDFDRYDFVLYMKAYALLEAGDQEGALALYRRILSDFPESRFVPDAHFAMAEHAFTNLGDHPAALREYEEVLRHRQSDFYDLALFKSAWCMWRMGDSQGAALRFRQVLDLGRDQARMTATQRRRLRELQDEALDYLIQVFIEDESNTAADVFAFLQEIGGEQYAHRVLVRLSDTYMGQSRHDRAIEGYRLLLEMDGTVPEAPTYQRQIAAAYAAMEDVENTIAALRTLAADYAPGSTWATQQADPEVVARARRRAERTIRRQAMRYHEIGQRDNQRRKLEQAVGLYGVYLEHYGDLEPAYAIQFYQAEILFHRLERYPEAGDAYLATARKDPSGQYTRDALYNAIGAYERVREQELEACAGPRARPQGRPAQPSPDAAAACQETENDRKFGEAITLYVELFPDDPDLPEILFRQGRLYYDRGVYDPAVRLFGQLIERFPSSEYANPAGELILDSFNRARDYANIESWARRLKRAPAFASTASQARLDGLILASMFALGEQLAGRGEHAEAADAYFRAAEEFPRDDRARQAYYNAGLERQRAGDLAGAATAYDRLIERYPGSSEGALGAWTAAQMYESIALFSDAARYYEAYGERFPRGDKAPDALYNAVLLRLTAGDYGDAVRVGRTYLERNPRREGADDVYFFMGRAHEGAERWGEAARVYREYIGRARNEDRKVEAATRLGQVELRAGNAQAAGQAFDQAVRLGRRNRARLRDGLYYAAQARFLQGDQILTRYEAIPLAGDVEGLRERLQRKSALLQEAALAYAEVVEFGVAEWVTAALFKIGRSYELFAEGMRGFEVPAGLSEEEEMAYQDQLNMFIIPMEERALEAYEGGYQKALELRIYNRWTAQLREALTRLNDVQYPPLREVGGELREGSAIAAPAPLLGLRREGAAGNGAEGAPDGGGPDAGGAR